MLSVFPAKAKHLFFFFFSSYFFFCPLERKIFPRDSRAMGRMCWQVAPPLGWHLFFTLFCLLDLVSAFSLTGLNWDFGFICWQHLWSHRRANWTSEGVCRQRAAVNEKNRYVLYDFYRALSESSLALTHFSLTVIWFAGVPFRCWSAAGLADWAKRAL